MDRLKDPPTWLKEIDLQTWAPRQWTSTTTQWWCGLILLPSLTNGKPEDWEASNGHTTRLFHGPWHDPVGEHICAQSCRMLSRLRFHPFLQVSQIFQRCKSDANKQDFENKLNLTCQVQSTPKTIGILTKVFCTSGPNLVALAWTDDELSRGQAQNGVNFDFEGKFDLEGKGQSPPRRWRCPP